MDRNYNRSIKAVFLSASSHDTFICVFRDRRFEYWFESIYWDVFYGHWTNERTGEQLIIERRADDYLLLLRCPISPDSDKWETWEDEAIGWIYDGTRHRAEATTDQIVEDNEVDKSEHNNDQQQQQQQKSAYRKMMEGELVIHKFLATICALIRPHLAMVSVRILRMFAPWSGIKLVAVWRYERSAEVPACSHIARPSIAQAPHYFVATLAHPFLSN
ncbi:hypothetical protein niasHT_031806 [Heterodera trifolii]|uniref:Uncharacterized protein n=1 Tax=Heterodera trifolii TaxID=157864 RepID=A0ABD2IH50_9BILA